MVSHQICHLCGKTHDHYDSQGYPYGSCKECIERLVVAYITDHKRGTVNIETRYKGKNMKVVVTCIEQ